jgi:hypothetical protein
MLTLVRKIERLTDFNSVVCKIITIIFKNIVFRKQTRIELKKNNKFDIIISNNHVSYFLNIGPVIEKLSKKYKVALVIEKDDAKSAILELRSYYPNCKIIETNYRLLPYFYSRVHLSSIAGKEKYFSRNSQRVFYFHGTANLAGFKKNGMTAYDVILCATNDQAFEVSLMYGGKTNCLVGYPKLSPIDLGNSKTPSQFVFSVIYCPSYRGVLNSNQLLQLFDHQSVIKSLLKNKLIDRLVIRPHPQDVKEGNIDDILNNFSDNPRIDFDYTGNYDLIYKESSALITDFSGTAVSYSLIYGRPAICVLKSIEFIKEMQPYAMEVCKISLSLNDLENSKYLKSTSIIIENKRLELRKLHVDAVKNFILAIDKCMNKK